MNSPRPLRLPIGISSFRQLREPDILYVDKTDFITQVLAAPKAVVLVPRPRRFGKTVNLSTLRTFVEKSEDDTSALFEGLSVWGSAEARTHFRRYPVISMTFKDIKARTFDEALEAIRNEISFAYREHVYLLDSDVLLPGDAARFRQILSAEGPASSYSQSLRLLSTFLSSYHKERVFILIDEYDTPIHAIQRGADERRLLDFFRAFLSGGLKDNHHLARGVMTGILRIAKESLFSGLNNLAVYSLLLPECATCFGFTEAEVKDLAVKTGAEASLPDLTRWYNGYRFGGEVIYNPWSVLNFLASADKVLRPYWAGTSSDDLLRRVVFTHGLGQSGELETLLGGGEIEKRIDDRVALRDLDQSPESVWSFLLYTGYLKATKVRIDEGVTRATLAVPNKEVEYVYRTLFLSWLEQRLGATQVDELLQAIVSGDVERCARLLEALLHSLSHHDVAARRTSKTRGGKSGGRSRSPSETEAESDLDSEVVLTPEQVYHVFVVGLLLGLQPRYLVRSNRESGGGRYDVMVIPRTPGQPGVVLELKVRNRQKRETEKGAMAAALRQLRERDYAAELRACGADPIHEIGVVFDGKRVSVEAAPPAGKRVSVEAAPPAGAPVRRSPRGASVRRPSAPAKKTLSRAR
jgi:hypothetical protein